MNIPNTLTVSRILLIPVMVLAFYLPIESNFLIASILFVVASCTDFLDGYLARKLNQSTPFGAFLDPVADKLIVAVSLVLIVSSYQSMWITIPATIIIGREIMISALREWMADQGKRESVAVSSIGKVKTACQMGAIFFLLIGSTSAWLFWVGVIFLYMAVALAFWSMCEYLSVSSKHFLASEI